MMEWCVWQAATTKPQSHVSLEMGMHTEALAGRSQQRFFDISEEHRLQLSRCARCRLQQAGGGRLRGRESRDVNLEIRSLIKRGYGTIVLNNPGAKHSLAVGILNRLNLIIKGSCGYFACGLIDGPNVRIAGRVGWACGENMLAGTIVIEKNAGSQFGAALRGGDLVCKGSVGGRTGVDQKGGTIIVGGDTGAFTGFMMQRGRMVICGDAGKNLGDSMYDGTIYIGGEPRSLGVDAVGGDDGGRPRMARPQAQDL